MLSEHLLHAGVNTSTESVLQWGGFAEHCHYPELKALQIEIDPHSTTMTPGLILSLVLPWFSAKTSPWHSWYVFVPGDWQLLSSGEKAVNRMKQKGVLAHLRSVVFFFFLVFFLEFISIERYKYQLIYK